MRRAGGHPAGAAGRGVLVGVPLGDAVPARPAWAASFYDSADQPIAVYVDVTTPAVWDGPHVTMVDLDLDVVLSRDGSLLLDDEDEFDEHRVTLGYPADVVALARRTADELMTAAAEEAEPFGDGGQPVAGAPVASTP